MTYVLVHWVASNETSILTENFVRDKTMLEDPRKEGMILFGTPGVKTPKHGWKAYMGRVLAVNERKSVLLMKEAEFLSNGSDDERMANSSKSKGKRTISESSSCSSVGTNHHEILKKPALIKKAKTAAERKGSHDILSRFIDNFSSGSDEKENRPEDKEHKITKKSSLVKKMSTGGLMKKVKTSVERKGSHVDLSRFVDNYSSDDEKENSPENDKEHIKKLQCQIKCLQSEVTQLRKANLMLQNELPKLLCQAMTSSSVVEKMNGNKTPQHLSSTLSRKQYFQNRSNFITSTPAAKQLQRTKCTEAQTPRATSSQTTKYDDQASTLGLLGDDAIENDVSEEASEMPSLSDFIDSIQMSEIEMSRNEKKMTTNLLSALFDKKVLAKSSVTGNSKEGCPALNKAKVQMIIDSEKIVAIMVFVRTRRAT